LISPGEEGNDGSEWKVLILCRQRADEVYVTINVSDVQDEKISIDENKLHFSAKSHGTDYDVTLDFFAPIDPKVRCQLHANVSRNANNLLLLVLARLC
jgi:hypothetical protein